MGRRCDVSPYLQSSVTNSYTRVQRHSRVPWRSPQESPQDRMRRHPTRSSASRIHRCGYLLQVRSRCSSTLSSPSDRPLQHRKLEVYNYAVSVPWRKVRQNEEVLLAWEMNGEPLPKIHGGPLRVVVAGYIGARSCKWVYRINALPEPSFGPVQRQEYLYYNQQVRRREFNCRIYLLKGMVQIGKQNVMISNGFSIQAMPVS